jgi:hypothetical protein
MTKPAACGLFALDARMNKETERLMVQMWSRQLLKAAQPSVLSRMFPPKPLTRRQKAKRAYAMWKQRFSDAWAMVRGNYDCGH